jgi:hypothetical protein
MNRYFFFIIWILFIVFLSSADGSYLEQSPGSEMGDAVFRPLHIPVNFHSAIYRNSDSKKDWDPSWEMINTSWEHSVIQGTGENYILYWQNYITFLWGFGYNFQLGKGYSAPGGLRSEQRGVVIQTARSQYGAPYPPLPWSWPAVKAPKNVYPEFPNGSFRCDGIIEYSYMKSVPGWFK